MSQAVTSESINIEDLWAQYQSSLKAFLYSRISNHADADDLLQDILIKSYSNLGSLKSQSSVKAWLFQIANNSLTDFYRKKARRQEINSDSIDDTDPDHFWHDERNSEESLADCIQPFIDALPASQAALLKAIDIQGVPQKQLAAEQQLAYSTLKSRVQKAREQLRLLFEDCCHLQLDAQGNIIEYTPKASSCSNCK